MKNVNFDVDALKKLKENAQTKKSKDISEGRISATSPNVHGKDTGKVFLANLANALNGDKNNPFIAKVKAIAEATDGAVVDPTTKKPILNKKKQPSVPAVNRDEDDAHFDNEIMKRMQQSNVKIQNLREDTQHIEQDHHYGNESKIQQPVINEDAVKTYLLEYFSKEKIREVINEELPESKIKKIVYEALKELKKMNEEKHK